MGLDFSDLYGTLSLTTELVMRMLRQMKSILIALPFAMPFLALAQGNAVGAGQTNAPKPSIAWSEGVVRTIYIEERQITISHGPIANLGMGKMTMTFRVKTPSLIEGIEEGSKIRFVAENVNGELTVVALQAAK